MKDYVTLWMSAVLDRPSLAIKGSVEVIGERYKHLGPRFDRATVHICFEPANKFEVIDFVENEESLTKLGYPDMVIFGILDVLMTTNSVTFTKLRVILNKAEFDIIDSSPLAFLEAGRDAARKLLIAYNENIVLRSPEAASKMD